MDENFVNDVKEKVCSKLKDKHCTVKLNSVVKLNRICKTGITILEDGELAAPTLYFEDFYPLYEHGYSIDEIADKMIAVNAAQKNTIPMEFTKMGNFEYAKDHITLKLIHTQENRAIIDDVPHITYSELGLTIIFEITVIDDRTKEVMSARIPLNIMNEWRTDIDELLKLGKENTLRMMGVYVKEMKEAFGDLAEDGGVEIDNELYRELDDMCRMPIYVLTNNYKLYGAVNIFMDGVLRNISAMLEDDICIIPSSMHEVLLVPLRLVDCLDDINAMICEITEEVLQEQDFLSGNCYIYSRQLDKIIMYE